MGRGPLSSARQISSNARQISSKFAPALCQICQYVKTAPSSGPLWRCGVLPTRPKPLTSELCKIGQKWQEILFTLFCQYGIGRVSPELARTRARASATAAPAPTDAPRGALHARPPCQIPSNYGDPSGPLSKPVKFRRSIGPLSNSVKFRQNTDPARAPTC